jgi:hypothetical protein
VRIKGINEFLSRFVFQVNVNTMNNISPEKRAADTLVLSDAAKKLCFGSVTKLIRQGNKTLGDPMLQLMDKSMSKVESILGEMEALAVAAQNEKLTDLQRIDMQIEMEDLRIRLLGATGAMSAELAESSGQSVRGSVQFVSFGSPGGTVGDKRSALERARDRIVNGEKWDVAEEFEFLTEVKEVRVGGTERSVLVKPGERVELPSDIDPKTAVLACIEEFTGGSWRVSDDEILPSVSEKLRAANSIILMDAKSATEGVERLRNEINGLQAARMDFMALSEKLSSGDPGLSRNVNFGELNARMLPGQDSDENNGDSNESGSRFGTELGIMKFTEGRNCRPRLISPTDSRGSMFSRLERLFDRISTNLAKIPISEAAGKLTASRTNADPFLDTAVQ